MAELDEKIVLLIDALLENAPRRTSERYNVGKAVNTVTHGTVMTTL